MKHYYLAEVALREGKYYCIWYSGEKTDGLFVIGEKVALFSSIARATAYSLQHDIKPLETELTSFNYNLDWADLNLSSSIMSRNIIDAWNFASDFAASVNVHFVGDLDEFSIIYDKLFHGCNLPAYRLDKPEYLPSWSYDELASIRAVIDESAKIIENNMEIIA